MVCGMHLEHPGTTHPTSIHQTRTTINPSHSVCPASHQCVRNIVNKVPVAHQQACPDPSHQTSTPQAPLQPSNQLFCAVFLRSSIPYTISVSYKLRACICGTSRTVSGTGNDELSSTSSSSIVTFEATDCVRLRPFIRRSNRF